MSSPDGTLPKRVRALLPETLPSRLGVAVSGGSDSLALLHLLVRIARDEGVRLFAATVDHGLRPDAAAEAASVSETCAHLGVSHVTLKWTGWDRSGNLQDQARQARYGLLRDWAVSQDIPVVALGHTADDQAETVLMRLGRAAGVRGLSAMSFARDLDGVTLWRPVLGETRTALRDYLRAEGVRWIEDPSNQDLRFDRIKAREALGHLSGLGITAETLSRVAANLGRANRALEHFAQESARRVAKEKACAVRMDRAGFAALPEEIQRRLVVGILQRISGPGYPPRQTKVEQVVQAVIAGRSSTLSGCQILTDGNSSWFCRELTAVSACVARPAELWDGRWIAKGPDTPGAQIRALGETGLPQVPDWRATGVPRMVLMVTPAVWLGDQIVSAPFAGFLNGWSFEMNPKFPEFSASFLSH